MDIHEACKKLNISIDDECISETTLKKQYRKMSLLYHPDKNKSGDAIQIFQEIHDSYEYLGKYLGYIDGDYYIDEYEEEKVDYCSETVRNFVSYKDTLMIFLNSTLGHEIIQLIQERLLNHFSNHEKVIKLQKFVSKINLFTPVC